MPFAGFEDFDACLATMTEEEGHDEQSAENICGALQAEAKADTGNVAELREALAAGRGLIADVGVDLVSGVDTPAVDSKWVMMKSGGGRKGHDFRANTAIVLRKDADTEQRLSYAAAMIPREPDKEGDVVATPTVEKAAHNFIKADGGIDTDHSLIDGEGEPVESWVLKEERTFDLPAGGSETYPAGTWMLGIEWGADAWDRIKAGELSGLSIYGNAEKVALRKDTAKDDADPCWEGYTMVGTDENGDPRCVPDDEVPDAEGFENAVAMDGSGPPDADTGGTPKSASGDSQGEQTAMSDADPDGDGGDDGGPTLESVAASVESLSETVSDLEAKLDGDPDGGAESTDKAQDYWDVIEPAAEDIAALDDIDMSTSEIEDLLGAALEGELGKVLSASTEKAINADTIVEMLASMEDIDAGADRISEQIDPLFEQTGEDPPEIENESDGDGMDDDEDDDEDEMGKSVTPGFAKGHGDGSDTAATAKDADGADGGLPSFRDVAEQKHGGL